MVRIRELLAPWLETPMPEPVLGPRSNLKRSSDHDVPLEKDGEEIRPARGAAHPGELITPCGWDWGAPGAYDPDEVEEDDEGG